MRLEVATGGRDLSAGVSVVVPCYNYGHYVDECLTSILVDNSDVETEVILIDDASTDDSAAACRKWAADPRVVFVAHETNRGHIATYNEGLALASKEYVALVSADDMLTPGALQRAVRLFERHPEVGMVYGRIATFTDEVPEVRRPRVTTQTIWPGTTWIEGIYKRGVNPVASPEVVVRTSVQRQVGGYDPRHPHAGDLEMWLRVAAVSDVARVNGAAQAFRRDHAASMSHTQFGSYRADLIARFNVFEGVLPLLGLTEATQRRILASAHRSLAREAVRAAALIGGEAGPSQADAVPLIQLSRRLDPDAARPWEWSWLNSTNGTPRSELSVFTLRVKKWTFFRSREWRLDFLQV